MRIIMTVTFQRAWYNSELGAVYAHWKSRVKFFSWVMIFALFRDRNRKVSKADTAKRRRDGKRDHEGAKSGRVLIVYLSFKLHLATSLNAKASHPSTN